MGAFSGGDKLKAAFAKILADLKGDNTVRVGFLEGSHCGPDNDESAPAIAYILEVGAPAANIPPRPFFRSMITRQRGTWGKALKFFLKKRKFKTSLALMDLGLVVGEQLQLEITETTSPENAPSTVERKGFDKPLEWSKNMKRAVAAEVGSERRQANGSA